MERLDEKYTMTYMTLNDQLLQYFPFARQAIDTRSQEPNRSSALIFIEAKEYFNEKHRLYWINSEVSVLPNALRIGMTSHFPESVSDIVNF